MKNYEKNIKDQQNIINNLNKKIQELNNEIAQNKKNKLIEEKKNKLKEDKIKDFEKLKEQFNSNLQELKDTKKNFMAIQKEKNELIDINTEKDAQIKELENENISIKKELEQLKNSREKESINNKIESKNKELEDKIDQLLSDNEKLKKDNSEIEKELQKEKQEKKNLKESLNNIETKYNNIINKNKELVNKQLELKEELNYKDKLLKAQQNSNNSKNDETLKRLDLKEKEIIELKDSYDLKMKEFDKLEKENLYLNNYLKEKSNESVRLQQKIDNYEKRINFLNQEMQSINNQKRNNEEMERNLQQQFNALNQKNYEIENKRKELQNDLKRNQNMKQEYDNLIFQNQQLMNEIQQKQNQLNGLTRKINQEKSGIQKNQSQSLSEPPKPLSPIRTYEKPTLIGLNNIGATCFMNATLQCFSQTKDLTNYFLKPQNKSKIINNNIANNKNNEPQLSPIYLDLINKLWAKNSYSKNFSPTIFMNTIEEMNPLFKQGQPGDSKDFIIFILEQFHKELKKAIKNKIQIRP